MIRPVDPLLRPLLRTAALALSLATAALVLSLSTVALAQSDPLGSWRGALGPGVIDLAIRVTITPAETGAGLDGTIDIPAQGFIGYPLVNVVQVGDALSFAVPGIPGDPVFDGAIDGDRIEGTFEQGGQVLAFVLERDLEPAALRPQEPLPPYPYGEEEVAFASSDITLAGTLTLPPGDALVPALLLITGSGPQDRNEEVFGHKPFLVIADHLTRAGYAVLRVDDRGVGGSTGSDAQATYRDLVGDALAAVALLRAHQRVDPERIGVLGHSQGGRLAPQAVLAADGDIAFAILLAGPAVDGFSVLVAQNERIIELRMRAADPSVSDHAVAGAIADQVAFLQALRSLLEAENLDGARALVRQRVETQLEALPDGVTVQEIVEAQQAALTSAVFRAFVFDDPQPFLRRLTVPTLALFGSLDTQVLAEQNEDRMREALAAAANPDATVITFPGLNHLMQPAITGISDEYAAIETTIDPAVLETITQWLQERFPSR